MGTIKRFEDIEVWKKAKAFTEKVYDLEFGRDYRTADQFRSAALSIMSNIAEGFDRQGNNEFVQFLSVAKGSAGEARSILYILKHKKIINEKQFDELCGELNEISSMIFGFIQYLRNTKMKGQKFRVGAGV